MHSLRRAYIAGLFIITLSLAQVPAPQTPGAPSAGARELYVMVGKSVIVDSPVNVQRVSVASQEIAEAVATTPREILINGKAPGETTLVVWQANGQRQFFDVIVEKRNRRLEGVQRELSQELQDQGVTLSMEDETPFLRGTVRDMTSAERAVAIVSTLGKPVNLLRVAVPPTDPQILIRIRFANVDRSASRELGLNIISNGLGGVIGRTTTGQFSSFGAPSISSGSGGTTSSVTISDALNLFFFHPELNLGATIKALQAKNLLEILAEPNVLAINGHTANFLAGGEFPFPTLQGGGAGLGAVTIQFREFGVRIAFTPTLTPRGTIRLAVTPEVSSLDFANGLVFQGFNIPALSTRRVQTAIELESGQSFAIGGMLDNRVTNNLSRIPGLGDIPFFGKLFRSQQITKNNTELLVFVTPELVRPIPAGKPLPELNMPEPFMDPNTATANATRTPGLDATGPVPNKPLDQTLPVEQLIRINQELDKQSQQGSNSYQAAPLMQFVPMAVPQQAAPAQTPAPAAPPAQTPAPVAPPAPVKQ